MAVDDTTILRLRPTNDWRHQFVVDKIAAECVDAGVSRQLCCFWLEFVDQLFKIMRWRYSIAHAQRHKAATMRRHCLPGTQSEWHLQYWLLSSDVCLGSLWQLVRLSGVWWRQRIAHTQQNAHRELRRNVQRQRDADTILRCSGTS